jgi:hypothetical protein
VKVAEGVDVCSSVSVGVTVPVTVGVSVELVVPVLVGVLVEVLEGMVTGVVVELGVDVSGSAGVGEVAAGSLGVGLCVTSGTERVMVAFGFWLGTSGTVAAVDGGTVPVSVADGLAADVECNVGTRAVAVPAIASVLVFGVSSGGATIRRANPAQ